MYYVAGSPGRVFLYTVFTETWIIWFKWFKWSIFSAVFLFPRSWHSRWICGLIWHWFYTACLCWCKPSHLSASGIKEYTSLWSPEGGLLPAPVSSCGSYTCKACSLLRRIYNHFMSHHVNGSLSWLLFSFDFAPPLRIKYWAEIKMPFVVVVLYHTV